MINIGFGIGWPFGQGFENLYTKDFPLTQNKNFELNLYKTPVLIEARFDWDHANDHAGATLWFGLLGYNLELKIFDKRHWNYDAERWMTEEDCAKEMESE